MSDLTDTQIDMLESNDGVDPAELPAAMLDAILAELRRHRADWIASRDTAEKVIADAVRAALLRVAQFSLRDDQFDSIIESSSRDAAARLATPAAPAQAASKERVRDVVREAVADVLAVPRPALNPFNIAAWADAIASCVADQLATPAVEQCSRCGRPESPTCCAEPPRRMDTREQYDARTGTTRHTVPATPAVLSAEERDLVVEVCHDLLNRAMRNEADAFPDANYSAECRAKENAIRRLLGGKP